MYKNAAELLNSINSKNHHISDVVIENEMRISELSKEAIIIRTQNVLAVMRDSATLALNKEIKSISGLTGGDAKRMQEYKNIGRTISGLPVNSAMAKAFSCSEVNASMGKVVAAPTAGSCGIVPAALFTAEEMLSEEANSHEKNNNDANDNISDYEEIEKIRIQEAKISKILVRGFLTAAGIGQIIAKNATLSGAEGGCQAECGSAAAMAAAALTEMYGGTPDMCLNAAGIALMNVLGLVCDPVAGLVELPCSRRNASGIVNAMSSADMALAGVSSIIPFDEIVVSIYNVGKSMHSSLKETALGGLATSPTGISLSRKIYGDRRKKTE